MTAGAPSWAPSVGRSRSPARRLGHLSRPVPIVARALRRGSFFGVWLVVYGAVGIKVVIHQHVVVGDGWSRLAHAYFVFYNHPQKLAAVGFLWPPLMTLGLLPFALVKPLATSLVALPLATAVFGAGMMTVLDRVAALAGMGRRARYPLLAAFGINPLILFYATNGMGEILGLLLLAVSVYALLAWYLRPRTWTLVLLSVSLALGILTRYEMVLWAAAAGLLVMAFLRRRGASRTEVGAAVVAYLLPVLYAIGLWAFLNWTIMGSPLYWLRAQTSGGNTGVSVSSRIHPPLTTVLHELLGVNAQVFFPALVALGALVLVGLLRRDLMSHALAVLLCLNALFTGVMFYLSNEHQYFELRYNMRTMPVVVAAVAWVYRSAATGTPAAGRRIAPRFTLAPALGRRVVWTVSMVLLVLAVPAAWHTMRTSTEGFLEDAFVRALPTLDDQSGTIAHVRSHPFQLGVYSDLDMAHYVRSHISARDSVLTDDSQTFGIMLFDGRPDVYWDRIDRGDGQWFDALAHPHGKVSYLLVAKWSIAGAPDLAVVRYPGLPDGITPGFRIVHANDRYVLLKVEDPAEPATASRRGRP